MHTTYKTAGVRTKHWLTLMPKLLMKPDNKSNLTNNILHADRINYDEYLVEQTLNDKKPVK